MSDLVQRLRDSMHTFRTDELCREASDRIEADEALLRQALTALECSVPTGLMMLTAWHEVRDAIRARLDAPC